MFKMRMLDEILGQFISVGVIALIIVFQQEIRSFLLMLGKLSADRSGSIRFLKKIHQPQQIEINTLTNALQNMSKTLTGALIVIRRNNELKDIIDTGERIDGILTAPLVESIFYKNNPLHDGAIIISHNKIEAARCVLPVSERTDFPPEFGLRHRAAAGLSQNTDALCIVVSEQTGEYAYSDKGELFTKIPLEEIHNILTQEFQRADNTKKMEL
jgi:uncharacterized protein (TIGR00159 family)